MQIVTHGRENVSIRKSAKDAANFGLTLRGVSFYL